MGHFAILSVPPAEVEVMALGRGALGTGALGSGSPSGDEPFDPLGFVLEYRKLGGLRQAAFKGDNYIINLFGPEPNEASQYWATKVEFLGKEERDAIAKALAEVLPL
jgi:hypothetical protein